MTLAIPSNSLITFENSEVIDAKEGLWANIAIKDSRKNTLYTCDCNLPDVNETLDHLGKSTEGYGILASCLFQARTDTLSHFAKDFFCPTLFNYALKINNIALKILASLFALILDAATLVCRFFTAPYKIYSDRKNYKEHELISFMNRNCPESLELNKAIKKGIFYIEAWYIKIDQLPEREVCKDFMTTKYALKTLKGQLMVTTKPLHGTREYSKFEEKFGTLEHGQDMGPPNKDYGWTMGFFSSSGTTRSAFAC